MNSQGKDTGHVHCTNYGALSQAVSKLDFTSKVGQVNGVHPAEALATGLCQSLNPLKLAELGRGDDAIVLGSKAADIALRISVRSEAFSKAVSLARTSGSPHLPTIYDYMEFSNWSVAFMELLRPAPDDEDTAFWEPVNSAVQLAYSRLDCRPSTMRTPGGSLDQVAHLVGDGAREFNYALDLNRNNILVRVPCGTAVLTDFWCSWGE